MFLFVEMHRGKKVLQLPITLITGRNGDSPADFVGMDSACPSDLFLPQINLSWPLSNWDPAACVI